MSTTTQRQRFSRLLVVEDDSGHRRTLVNIMQKEGFDVVGCETASEALGQIKQVDFGVAVIDLRLPDFNGGKLLEKIRDIDRQVRVIINTGYGSFDSAKDALNLGAFAYVEKAGNPEELVRYAHAASRWHLDRYARELEEAVMVRTTALHAANDTLRTEIAERKLAEESIKQSEEKLRNIVEHSSNLFYSHTPQHELTYLSPQVKDYLECEPEEAMVCWTEFITDNPVNEMGFELTTKAIETGEAQPPYELELIGRKGRKIWVEVREAPVVKDGKTVSIVGALTDITERKLAEKHAARFSRMLEHSMNEIYIFDAETLHFVEVNRGARENLGYSIEELRDFTPLDLKPEFTVDSLAELLEPLRAGVEEMIQFTTVHRRKDGTHYPVEIHLQLVGDDAPVFVAVILEITERKRAEEERVRLMSAIEQVDETVIITDAKGAIQYANPAFERITGYSREEAIGQTPRILKSGEHDRAFYKEMWNTLARGKTWSGRFTDKRKDGTLFEEDAVISPVCDSLGKIVNYVAVKRDVTKEVVLEAHLRQSQKLEAIGQLAGGVAHDFGNLLTAIMGNTETLLSAVVEKAAATTTSEELLRSGLEEIQLAAKHAASLTRQLLAFGRRETTRPEVLDPKKVVGDMEGLLRRLVGEHIQLEFRLSAGTYFIHVDPGQIEQIAMNLAINAADAMPNGGRVEIRIESTELDETYVADHADAKPGRHVLLSVADNGTGMTPDTLEHLFEPYFTTKPVGKGTGLGLATVYGIVKQLGGHIRVDSELGEGSTFTVYIPVVDGKEAEAETEAEKEPDATPARSCAGETILVCEDQAMVRDVMYQALCAAGYKVIEADHGKQALEAATAHVGTIDLLISDVVMPGMSGIKLADSLALERPNMRVLFVSGYSANHLDAHGTRGGVAELLQKPFGPPALLRRVRKILDARRVIG